MEQMQRRTFEIITTKTQHEIQEGKSTSFSNWRSCDHQRCRVKQGFMEIGSCYQTLQEKGGIVRATKIRCGKSELQRAVQHLYPMMLYCHWKYNVCFENNEVNEDDQGQEPRRSKRTAAAVAKIKILD